MKHLERNLEKMTQRDHLAFDRTIMANKRTILAFLRTSIMLFATGVTIIKVFTDSVLIIIIGSILILSSILLLIFGSFDYYRTKCRLRVEGSTSSP